MKAYLLVTSLLALVVVLYAGCAERGCCTGKDNKCMTKGERETPSNKTTCFCDETCIVLGDCCADHKRVCIGECCIALSHNRYNCDVIYTYIAGAAGATGSADRF